MVVRNEIGRMGLLAMLQY